MMERTYNAGALDLLSCYNVLNPDFICVLRLGDGPSGHAVKGVGLWAFACRDCGFEFHRGHGCLSVVSVVCCQVEVSATDRSLV